MVQIWSTRLNLYRCTKFPRNLRITRLGLQSSEDKTGPSTKKKEAQGIIKIWRNAEIAKGWSRHKEKVSTTPNALQLTAIIHGHYTKRAPAVHKDERDRPLNTSI
ncbi:hypothetical protein ACS0TY_028592 [Phlomoides rotata]